MRKSTSANTNSNGGFSWGRRLSGYMEQVKAAKEAYEKQIEQQGTMLINTITSQVEGQCLLVSSKGYADIKKTTIDSEKVTLNYTLHWYFNLCKPLLHFGSKKLLKTDSPDYKKFFGDEGDLNLKVYKKHISHNEFESLKKQNQGARPVFTESEGERQVRLIYYVASNDEDLIKKGNIRVNAD